MLKKKCYMCDSELGIELFSKNKSNPDGLNSHCKECHSKYRKEYYIKNKEREKALVEKLRQEKRIKFEVLVPCIICGKLVYRRKRELRKGHNIYCSQACRSKYMDKGVINFYLKEARARARVKNLELDLDHEFLYDLFHNKQKGKCAIMGVDIKLMKSRDYGGIHEKASLDRMDSKRGYTKDNVRFVVLGINYMKNNRPDWQLLELLKRIKCVGSSIG